MTETRAMPHRRAVQAIAAVRMCGAAETIQRNACDALIVNAEVVAARIVTTGAVAAAGEIALAAAGEPITTAGAVKGMAGGLRAAAGDAAAISLIERFIARLAVGAAVVTQPASGNAGGLAVAGEAGRAIVVKAALSFWIDAHLGPKAAHLIRRTSGFIVVAALGS